MISISNKPRYSDEQLRSIKIGMDIRAAVIEEGRAETKRRVKTDGSSDVKMVFGYLDHDLIGTGKLPFVKYDQRTGKTSRTFEKSLADRIRSHVADLKVYFDYVLSCDSSGSSSRNDRQARAADGHVKCDCHGVTRSSISSSGVKTAVLAVAVAAACLASDVCISFSAHGNEIRSLNSSGRTDKFAGWWVVCDSVSNHFGMRGTDVL